MNKDNSRREFAEKYNLSIPKNKDDRNADYWFHAQSRQWIISHQAVEKVAGIEGVVCKFQDVESRYDVCVAIKCIATYKDITIETYGEASPQNCISKYYYAMAEKRGFDRAVLKLVNVYDLFYSDSEIQQSNPKPNRKEKSEQELDSHGE